MKLSDFEFLDVKIDEQKLKLADSEDVFNSLAVELLKEVGQITSVLASTYRLDDQNNPRPWTREEAIIGGLMMRATKLQITLLEQFCQLRTGIAEIIIRCFGETLINIQYLLSSDSEDVYHEFIEYGLRHDKRLLKTIEENIISRGKELPIERRMKASITKSFEASGLNFDDVDEKKFAPWGDTIYNRAKKIGWSERYFVIFGFPNDAVHGNWSDLCRHHLTQEGNFYFPFHDWPIPRPQMMLASALMCSTINISYLEQLIPECEDKEAIRGKTEQSITKIMTVDLCHEEFIIANKKNQN